MELISKGYEIFKTNLFNSDILTDYIATFQDFEKAKEYCTMMYLNNFIECVIVQDNKIIYRVE